ncbi:MAG: hypothetical protein IJE77_03265, partial [Thermoguttaceae bacterium]|nr:hypothetical protein [Thermoguttaceae bacterium]
NDSANSDDERGSGEFNDAEASGNRQSGENGQNLSPRDPEAEESRRVVVPPIIVVEDDSDEAGFAKRDVSGDSWAPKARRRRRLGKKNKKRKIFGLIPVPARWREH